MGAVAEGARITVPVVAEGAGVVAQPVASATMAKAASRRRMFMAGDFLSKRARRRN